MEVNCYMQRVLKGVPLHTLHMKTGLKIAFPLYGCFIPSCYSLLQFPLFIGALSLDTPVVSLIGF